MCKDASSESVFFFLMTNVLLVHQLYSISTVREVQKPMLFSVWNVEYNQSIKNT